VIPILPLQGSTMFGYTFIQTMLILFLIAMVCGCTIPSAYLYHYMTSEFTLIHPEFIEPWISAFKRGPGLLLILIPVLWMVTFTFLVIVTKWVLIGRYKSGRYAIWSIEFARWWFVDRMLDIWELLIGTYLLDTPYLNAIYMLLGMNCNFSVRFKTFVREFDLIHCGSNSIIKGVVLARLVDLLIDAIYIDKNIELKATTCTYPGTTEFITDQSKQILADASYSLNKTGTLIWIQIQRILLPFLFMFLIITTNYFSSWMTSHYTSTMFEWQAARVL
jgi:hypothetical protein